MTHCPGKDCHNQLPLGFCLCHDCREELFRSANRKLTYEEMVRDKEERKKEWKEKIKEANKHNVRTISSIYFGRKLRGHSPNHDRR